MRKVIGEKETEREKERKVSEYPTVDEHSSLLQQEREGGRETQRYREKEREAALASEEQILTDTGWLRATPGEVWQTDPGRGALQ